MVVDGGPAAEEEAGLGDGVSCIFIHVCGVVGVFRPLGGLRVPRRLRRHLRPL